jgi:hypothetical protein
MRHADASLLARVSPERFVDGEDAWRERDGDLLGRGSAAFNKDS